VLPCGLNHSCVSTHASIHKNDAVLNRVLRESFIADKNVGPAAVSDDCGAG